MRFEDQQGNRLIALIPAARVDISDFAPLTHSLVVCKKDHRILFVFNNWKKHWELPGGIIEEGETAHACALRELFEESGQRPDHISLHAIMEWNLGPSQKKEFGALYVCDSASDAHRIDTDEISATRYWDLKEDIGVVAPLDITLSKLTTSMQYLP